MVAKIKKILYATDLSQNSAYAFQYAVNAAEKNDAQIFILHVLERIPSAEDWLLRDSVLGERLRKEYETERVNAAAKIKERLEEFCQRELKEKPALLKRVTIQVIDGNPAAEILKKADEFNPDMVVIGTHGKGLLAHAFLGSVAEKVLNRIKIPVFIIPIPEKAHIGP
jgi:nucleotide-binding universal stress UspA family protein